MRYHHGHKRRMSGAKIAVIVLALAAVYVGILVGVRMIGERIEGVEQTEPVGSLEGRFDTEEITLHYQGREWNYRRRDLTNILLIGIDWAELDKSTSSRYDDQADFLLLMTLDRKNKSISYIQIDRDTITPIRVYGPFGDYAGMQTTQICLSQAFGESRAENCENTAWAVSHLLGGIPVDFYMAMDMEGIAALNDALGGVTVTLEDDFTHLDAQMKKGATLTLQGKQAEYFVRGRMGIGEGTNEARMNRQRVYIQSVMDIITQGIAKDMNYAGTLYDKIEAHLETNMDRGQLVNKAYASRGYEQTDVHPIAGSHSIGTDGFMEFHADKDALGALLTDIFFE